MCHAHFYNWGALFFTIYSITFKKVFYSDMNDK